LLLIIYLFSPQVVIIQEDTTGHIDLNDLNTQLRAHSHIPIKIGSFSAASNVTGVISDVNAITKLLHSFGAFAFWDYAGAGPHLQY
jgi:selenocysteine lyase/cysteine desulfurase